MSLEKLSIIDRSPKDDLEKEYKRKDRSSQRLVTALEVFTKIAVREIKVEGLDYISEIPPDRKVVIAVSHASDLDLPLVAGLLSKYFDIVITNQSVQYKFSQDPGSNVAMKISGIENYLPIDYQILGSRKPRKFNPENFKTMAEAMENGRSVVIAAHNPSHQGTLERGAYGAVYLSEITGAIILPVGVSLESEEKEVGMSDNKIKTLLQRPVANIKIGKPFEPQRIEGINRLAEIIEERKKGEKITEQELSEFSGLKDELKNESRAIIDTISELVAPEKRLKNSEESTNSGEVL